MRRQLKFLFPGQAWARAHARPGTFAGPRVGKAPDRRYAPSGEQVARGNWRSRLALLAMAASMLLASAPRLAAQTTLISSEDWVRMSDPALYATARKYFPSDEGTAPPRRIFRLTRDQIDMTVGSLLPGYAGKSVKSVMQKDLLQTNYEYSDLLSVTPANAAPLASWFGEIAERVRKNPDGLFNCPGDKPAEDCLAREARQFVMRAFRGDVPPERLEAIAAFFLSSLKKDGLAVAAGNLVEVVLNSPSFLYRMETDVTKTRRLTPVQLLQSVTYTIADAPAERLDLDSRLADQYLRTGPEAAATLKAIVASSEAREKLVRFFKAWLEVREPADFTISKEVFPEFTPEVAGALVDEADRFLRAELNKPAPRLKDIMLSTRSFLSRPLARIYAVKSDVGQKPMAVSLDPSQRLGVLSLPAVIASHSGPTDARTIKRGVFWARKLMCMALEPPPKDLHAELYENEGTTERIRIEQSTRAKACIGCHKIINPFGFMLENYDALGRWRTLDNGQPIDASIDIDFLDEGKKKAAGPVEALRTLSGSLKFKQCFVRQMFRYYMGRNEEASDDPGLRRMFLELASNEDTSILSLVYMLASSDRVVRRQ